MPNIDRKYFLGVSAVIAAVLPLIVHDPYFLHLVILIFLNATLGMGFSLIFSSGLITLGAAAFWGIGAYASALLVTKAGLSFWAALPSAMVISGIIAIFIGYFIVRYVGAGFVVFTLLFCLLTDKVFGYFDVFGGWGGLTAIPAPNPLYLPSLGKITFSNKAEYYYLGLFLVVIIVVVLHSLYSSRIGRVWKAIRFGPELAQTLGVNVNRYRLAAFSLASAFAGLLGSFYAHYNMTISPLTFDVLKSVHIQIYAILGGLEFYIFGPFIGSFIFTLLPEFLRINDAIEPYVTGVALIVLVVFLPGGLTGLLREGVASVSRRGKLLKRI